jgi:hypothetical protein
MIPESTSLSKKSEERTKSTKRNKPKTIKPK